MPVNEEADALLEIAGALDQLGNNRASTSMGAIEAHGLAVKEAAQEIADALRAVADAIRERRK